ncbi:MAG: ribokinase [Ruminococcaceae bacterium]|nr:ribokinase [Oscillospiraceae bacterium]
MGKDRVLVVSSANIDFVQRMIRVPYSGETIIEKEGDYSYVPGGKGANSAIAFARFGGDCVFACRVGNDSNGKRLIAMYEKEGIDTRYIVKDEDEPTGLASILVEDNGKNRIICYPGANGALCEADIEESFICYPDAVFMQMEIPDAAVLETARRANEAGIPVFIDAGPARSDFPLRELGRVEIFSPNETETRTFTGIAPTGEESALRAAIKLSTMVDAKYIVIKWGERGAFIYDGKEYYVIPAEDVTPVDTTAAGDIFSAVMTYVYMQTGNIVTAVKYANVAAAISVTRPGASTSIPTRAEVMEYVKNKKKDKTQELPDIRNGGDE